MRTNMTQAEEAFVAAAARLIEQSESDGRAMALITALFVSSIVATTESYGHDTSGEIRIEGGKDRDITIHAPKTDIGTGF